MRVVQGPVRRFPLTTSNTGTHMALAIAGALLVAMGLFAGGVLVAEPLGLIAGPVDATLWLLFPLLSLTGFVLFIIGAKTAQIRGLAQAISWALLALALAWPVACCCVPPRWCAPRTARCRFGTCW